MRSVQLKLGFGLAATLTVGVAMTASASAASFLASITGVKLLSEKVANQVFTTEEGKIECAKETITKSEETHAGVESARQLIKVKYETCIAFGLIEPTISEAEYNFLANGSVELVNPIKVLGSIRPCEVVFAKQLVKTVEYSTNGHNIKVSPAVSGLKYTANASCAHPGSFSNGLFSGTSEWMIPNNGLLIFMP
jgi:hypothetical protein